MKYEVMLEGSEGEGYVASCPSLGVSSEGLTPANALDALRANIRFHLEFCPCSTLSEEEIELDVSG